MAESSSQKEMKGRISRARQQRSDLQEYINGFYDLALPLRQRLNETTTSVQTRIEEEAELFDSTLQSAVEDFASYVQDQLVPDYRPWVKGVPGVQLTTSAQKNAFEKAYPEWEDRLYSLINTKTDFYEQQHELMSDLAGAAAGIIIPAETDVTKSIRCAPVMMNGLLFDEGPHNDLDGRWAEMRLRRSHLGQVFPTLSLDQPGLRTIKRMRPETMIKVVQGCYRDWDAEGGPQWRWMVMLQDRIAIDRALPREAPPPVIVARWRHNPPSAWGPGPASSALPKARALDELSYLNLRKLGKETDPPHSYEDDGTFNPEGGVDPGTWIARRPGSKAPEPMFEPTASTNVFFEREKMEQQIKRALFVEEPGPQGKTPPSATQFIEEVARAERRQQQRRRLYREYVLPCLKRFAYIFSLRGELPPVDIGGQAVEVKFVSPLSKASDTDEVMAGMNLAQTSVGVFGEGALAEFDLNKTMRNWKERLGDTTVEITEPQNDPIA